ncbi:unnamed protein product, partial [Coregonus sp. 'balchen']
MPPKIDATVSGGGSIAAGYEETRRRRARGLVLREMFMIPRRCKYRAELGIDERGPEDRRDERARLTSPHPQRVFKVVFLGNSGVGKSSFIHHILRDHFPNTTGVDFQMRTADGILTMYDITDSASFSAVREWMDLVQERMSEGAVLMLLGNKMDLSEAQKREVTTREGQRLAEQDKAVFYECSARSGYNIEELMTQLA